MDTEGEQRPEPVIPREPPNKILFVQNLPDECTDEMLTTLFKQ